MSTTATSAVSQSLRARTLKSAHPEDHDHLVPSHPVLERNGTDSSGTSTPVPDDAPPSVKSLSSARKQVRARHRLFHTIDYVPRVSHFDPQSDYHNFRGFFTLFWVGLFIMVVTTVLRNIKDTGYPLRVKVWSLLSANVWQLAISDLAMVTSSALALPIQRMTRSGFKFLHWSRGGSWIHIIYQFGWLTLWIKWPFMLHWTWTAQVFFTLHTLTILMKMHSYAFYNGHLSETERRLSELDKPGPASMAAAVHYPSSPTRTLTMNAGFALKKDEPLSKLRDDLATELTSPLGHVTYPQNLSTANFIDFLFCPTLCYELEYPRTPNTRWTEVFLKTLAIFGCIFLLTLTSEEFIVPVLNEANINLSDVTSVSEKALILAETTSMLLFPFMITFLLVFLVIFEYVLGAFAEITCFADRRFYSDWWNSCDWLEFSREWNIPVHHFLRRHVYFSSKSYFSPTVAMLITFLVSALAHELVMSCITKKLRGYGFLAMMLQLPIIAVQRSQFIRRAKIWNNIVFWFSMILGLSMMCALYVLV
ncbi:putative sterol o-acyltransferase [Talaromyces proteolyticus]|uniref:O-acyltransferase n=1 Tax=Talaromyces proteolyticus TaxID=1131652 RepID=A0AAD4PXJ0_9EURO|nr:putative sterol o-acyltransferase [Talaromyces proteolyticus]KAH8692778.1 putative sterol o-acyltransferase [Talaromyces proteolyticus]